MAIFISPFVNFYHSSPTKSLSNRSINTEIFDPILNIFAHLINETSMKSSQSVSGSNLHMSPHPPTVPFVNKNEPIVRTRHRRYTHQLSDQKSEMTNFDNREIKSAGSNYNNSFADQKPDRLIAKTKISSAPSPRSRLCSDYRSNNIKRESSGLYTFDSIPSLVQDNNDLSVKPRTKRKENITIPKSNSTKISNEPNLPSLLICKSIKPCKSEASPVTSTPFTLRVARRSLQQLSKEKMSQLSRKSMQSSLGQSRKLDNLSDLDNQSSVDIHGNEPIDLRKYRLPSDLSESFEARLLASLVAQNAHEDNLTNPIPQNVPNILNSKDFVVKHSQKITPRTEALMCGSYSDEESSAAAGPCINRIGNVFDQCNNLSNRIGMHNEWKSRINCSQETSKSIDFINSVTDSICNSILIDDTNGSSHNNINNKSSRCQDYLLVHYIPDLGYFYDPKTGIFYESTL